jgi:uncharacterized membrane protein YbhN (UPF0104 family)
MQENPWVQSPNVGFFLAAVLTLIAIAIFLISPSPSGEGGARAGGVGG